MYPLLAYVSVLIVGGVFILFLALRMWRAPVIGARPFAVFLGAVALWTLGYAGELFSVDLPQKLVLAQIQYIGIVAVPVAWFQFVWSYTGHSTVSRCRCGLLLIIPVLTLGLVWTNAWHGLIWRQVGLEQVGALQVLAVEYGLWFWIHVVYTYSLLLLGFFVLIRTYLFSPILYWHQVVSFIVGALIPWFGNVLYLLGKNPLPGLDFTPFGFTISGAIIALAVFRFNLLRLVPMAHRLVFSAVPEGLIVLDSQQRIVDVNPAVRCFTGQSPDALLGRSASSVLADYGTPERWLPDHPEYCAEVQPSIPNAPAHVEVRSLPLGTASRFGQGRLVLLRDCTPQHTATAALHASVAQARQHAEAAQRHAQEVNLLNQVRTALALELDLPALYRAVVEGIAATFGYAQVSLYIVQDHELVLQHQVGYNRVLMRIPLSQGVAGRVARTGEAVLLEDVRTDSAFLGVIDGIASEICVPLTYHGQTVGILNVESTNGVVLTKEDFRLILALSEHINIAFARARMYDETQRIARQLRAVVTSVPMVLFAADRNGYVTLSEGKGLAGLGLKPGELVGKSLYDMYADQPWFHTIEAVLAGQDVHHVGEIYGRILDMHLTPIVTADGQHDGLLGVALDVTEQRRAEEERSMLERSFVEAQKMESLGMLAGGIAHDFNNLLQAILGSAQLLTFEIPDDSPAAESLARIEVAATRAAELTQQILTYAGKSKAKLEPLDLAGIIHEMMTLLMTSAGKKVALRADLSAPLSPLLGDATQIRQVLLNLITNATESITAHTGEVTLATGERYLDRATLAGLPFGHHLPEGMYVFVEIRDTGCGMDADTRARIFEPFFTTKSTGRGLGLAAVFGIVRSHAGTIDVQSAPNQGTTVRAYLPVAPKSSLRERAPDHLDAMATATGAALASNLGTVLIIDDEAELRSVLTRILERVGFRVLTAGDGQEGLALFREMADCITCVLLDLTMPNLSGEQVMQELHQLHPGMPTVLMSGYAADTIYKQTMLDPAVEFLQKPFTNAQLFAAIERTLCASADDVELDTSNMPLALDDR